MLQLVQILVHSMNFANQVFRSIEVDWAVDQDEDVASPNMTAAAAAAASASSSMSRSRSAFDSAELIAHELIAIAIVIASSTKANRRRLAWFVAFA